MVVEYLFLLLLPPLDLDILTGTGGVFFFFLLFYFLFFIFSGGECEGKREMEIY